MGSTTHSTTTYPVKSNFRVSRLVAGLVGGLLVYYAWRRKTGIVSSIVSTVGLSLIARSIGNDTLTNALKERNRLAPGPFNMARRLLS